MYPGLVVGSGRSSAEGSDAIRVQCFTTAVDERVVGIDVRVGVGR